MEEGVGAVKANNTILLSEKKKKSFRSAAYPYLSCATFVLVFTLNFGYESSLFLLLLLS